MSESGDRVDDWIERFFDFLGGDAQVAPQLDELPAELRSEARQRAEVLTDLWGRQAQPYGAMGEVATSIGFQHLDSTVTIAGSAMRSARKAAGLTVSELARELSGLGWQVSGAELGEVETGKRLSVPGRAVPLLAAVLELDADVLVLAGESAVDRVLGLAGVQKAIGATANRLERTVEDITAALRPQLAGAQFRNQGNGETDLVEIVEALLSDMGE